MYLLLYTSALNLRKVETFNSTVLFKEKIGVPRAIMVKEISPDPLGQKVNRLPYRDRSFILTLFHPLSGRVLAGIASTTMYGDIPRRRLDSFSSSSFNFIIVETKIKDK